MLKNISAYIAGDKNIVYPAIVTLMSVKKYNKDIDCFIVTECDFINEEQKVFCKNNNITLIDIKEVDDSNYLANFSDMKRWPFQIFINYLVPVYLKEKYGYDYAIKLDYDMLCIDFFDIEEILPKSKNVLTVVFKSKLSSYITKEEKIKIEKYCQLKVVDEHTSCNVGTIVIDLAEYAKLGIHVIFLELYKIFSIQNFILVNETVEQFIFGLIQSKINCKFKKLDATYNCRPGVIKKLPNKVKILHYNTIFKPWVEVNLEEAEKRTRSRNFSIFSQVMYFNEYIRFCNTLNLRNFSRRTKEYSPFELQEIFLKLKNILLQTLENESLLTIYISKLLMLIPNIDYKIAKNGMYLQIFINKEKNLHYEFVFEQSSIQLAIHLEKEWLPYKGILSSFNILDCFESIPFVLNIQKGKAYYVIDDVRNYDLIVNTMHSLIIKTQPFIEKQLFSK